ncbi:MAG TPA: hypothetical protein VNK48_16980 [Xanthobacteraceae bacterium]|nr:hypothetical protein [Xanthobacteraceae bacterium]
MLHQIGTQPHVLGVVKTEIGEDVAAAAMDGNFAAHGFFSYVMR